MKKSVLLILILFLVNCYNKPLSKFQIVDGKSIGELKLGKKLNPSLIKDEIGYKIDEDSVIEELFTTDKRFFTSKGVRVGDNISTVENLYGKPKQRELVFRSGKHIIMKAPNYLVYKKITFYYENDTIKSIILIKWKQ